VKAANFVASAAADGHDALGESAGRKLSTSTLYDFSREGLGNNFTLRVPLATFRYLHVSITPAISPTTLPVPVRQRITRLKHLDFPGRCHPPSKSAAPPGSPAISIRGSVGRILFTVPPGSSTSGAP